MIIEPIISEEFFKKNHWFCFFWVMNIPQTEFKWYGFTFVHYPHVVNPKFEMSNISNFWEKQGHRRHAVVSNTKTQLSTKAAIVVVRKTRRKSAVRIWYCIYVAWTEHSKENILCLVRVLHTITITVRLKPFSEWQQGCGALSCRYLRATGSGRMLCFSLLLVLLEAHMS